MDALRFAFAFAPFVGDIDDVLFVGDAVALVLVLELALGAVVAGEFNELSDKLGVFAAAAGLVVGAAIAAAAAIEEEDEDDVSLLLLLILIGDIGDALLGCSGGLNGIIIGGVTFVLSFTDLKTPEVRVGDLSLDFPGEVD